MIEHVFRNCLLGIEDQAYADGTTGKTLVIAEIAPESDPPTVIETWRYPMNEEQATTVGKQLQGSAIIKATAADLPGGMHPSKNGQGHPANRAARRRG